MSLIEWFAGFGSTVAGYLVPFLFVLTVVVFFHELGHFLAARWAGVAVKVFSVGFGPEVFGFDDRKGTRWRLSLIPLGGYVKFLDDENAASTPDRRAFERMSPTERASAFAGKGVAARAAIVAAGPAANFLLAIAIFTAIFSIYGREVITPRVDSVVAGSVAERAGFQPGDIVKSIDGRPIDSFNDLQRIVSVRADNVLSIVVRRGEEDVTLLAAPERKVVTDRFGNEHRIGVLGVARDTTGGDIVTQRFSVPEAAWLATGETWFVTTRTLSALGAVIVGRESAEQLGGPIRIAQLSAQVATLGLIPLINFAAFMSISIGLINLFPIPMLDGGHLLFFAIEAVRGKPLSDRTQEIGFRIGFAALVALMIFVTTNDAVPHFQRWFGAG